MPESVPRPPPQLMWLVDLIGEPASLAVVEAHGGTRVYVAHNPAIGINALVAQFTSAGANNLAQEFAGNSVRIPSCKPWRVQIYRKQGKSHTEIARKLGLDVVSVARLLQSAGMTDPDRSRAQKRRVMVLASDQLSLNLD